LTLQKGVLSVIAYLRQFAYDLTVHSVVVSKHGYEEELSTLYSCFVAGIRLGLQQSR